MVQEVIGRAAGGSNSFRDTEWPRRWMRLSCSRHEDGVDPTGAHLKFVGFVDEVVLPAPPHVRNLRACGWQARARTDSREEVGDLPSAEWFISSSPMLFPNCLKRSLLLPYSIAAVGKTLGTSCQGMDLARQRGICGLDRKHEDAKKEDPISKGRNGNQGTCWCSSPPPPVHHAAITSCSVAGFACTPSAYAFIASSVWLGQAMTAWIQEIWLGRKEQGPSCVESPR